MCSHLSLAKWFLTKQQTDKVGFVDFLKGGMEVRNCNDYQCLMENVPLQMSTFDL